MKIKKVIEVVDSINQIEFADRSSYLMVEYDDGMAYIRFMDNILCHFDLADDMNRDSIREDIVANLNEFIDNVQKYRINK